MPTVGARTLADLRVRQLTRLTLLLGIDCLRTVPRWNISCTWTHR